MPSTSAALSAGSIVKGPRASFRIVSVYQQTPYSITYIADNLIRRYSTGDNGPSTACGLPNFSGYCLLKEFFWREACVRDTESDAVLLASDSDSVILRFNDLCDSFISKGHAVDNAIFEICDSVLYRGRETKIATPVVFEANNTAYAVFDVNPKVQFRPADYVRSRGAMPAANLKELFEPLLFEMGAVSQEAHTAFFSGDEGGLMLPGRTLLYGYSFATEATQTDVETDLRTIAAYMYILLSGHPMALPISLPPEKIFADLKSVAPSALIQAISLTLTSNDGPRTAWEFAAAAFPKTSTDTRSTQRKDRQAQQATTPTQAHPVQSTPQPAAERPTAPARAAVATPAGQTRRPTPPLSGETRPIRQLDKPTGQNTPLKPKSKSKWLVAAALTVAVLAGAGVFFWQKYAGGQPQQREEVVTDTETADGNEMISDLSISVSAARSATVGLPYVLTYCIPADDSNRLNIAQPRAPEIEGWYLTDHYSEIMKNRGEGSSGYVRTFSYRYRPSTAGTTEIPDFKVTLPDGSTLEAPGFTVTVKGTSGRRVNSGSASPSKFSNPLHSGKNVGAKAPEESQISTPEKNSSPL